MNKLYLFINYVKGISALLFMGVCSFLNSGVLAQSVNINVNITPPYSPFYSDYSGANASKVFLTLQNLTNTTKNIKLTGQLEGDNGIRITTKSNYVPLQPIVLNPNQVRQLNGLALKDIFDVNTLNVYGVDKVKLVQTSRLPEGNYKFCIQAVDMATNQVLSATEPLGCTTISITYPDAPVLIAPQASSSVFATTPQSVVFNWINAGFAPAGTQYVLQLAEIPRGVRDPNQLLNSVSFPLVNKTLSGFSYVLSPADPPLVVGKRYAWRVKALDPTGRTVFKNNGISAANIFTYAAPIVLASAPTLVSPVNEFKISAAAFKNGAFKWNKTVYRTVINYNLQVVEVKGNTSDLAKLFNNANQILINKTLTGDQYLVGPADYQFVDGKKYAWRVRALSSDGRLFANDGYSNIQTFNCTNEIGKEILAAAPVITTPTQNAEFKGDAKKVQPNINIVWTPVKVDYPVNYELKVIKVPNGISPEMAVTANLSAAFSKTLTATSITLEPGLIDKNKPTINLEQAAKYAIVVKATPVDTTKFYQKRVENNGLSKPVVFNYLENTEHKLANTPISTSITGRLFYRHKEANEQPNDKNLGFPAVTVGQKVTPGTMIMENFDIYNNANFPAVVGNNRFSMGSNAKPLKNATANFVYVIFKSSSKNPTKFSSLNLLSEINTVYYGGYSKKINGKNIAYNKLLKTVKLSTDGSFNVTFDGLPTVGYLGSEGGISYFGGILALIADDRYYTSPDLILFPKLGQTTTMPDDIVFVKSYDLDLTVKASKTEKIQALDPGKPIANYLAQVADIGSYLSTNVGNVNVVTDAADDTLTLPDEANAESNKGQLNKDGKPIIDNAKTDANGVAHFKNLLSAHTHQASAVNSKFEGTLSYVTTDAVYIAAIKPGHFQAEFNGTYTKPVIAQEVFLKPKKPEIYLRAVTIQNGLTKGIPLAKAHIRCVNELTKEVTDEYHNADENGYLYIPNLKENVLRTITLIKPGFANKQVGAYNQKILLGERFPATVEQEMLGGGNVVGVVVNELGKPVECNIKVGDGPFIKTKNGVFTIQNTPTGWRSLQVVPTVDNYFSESLAPMIKSNGEWTLVTNTIGAANGTIVVKERLHRVQFKVVDEAGNPIFGASVGVKATGRNYLTQKDGLTSEISIASPDDEFKITASAANYVKYDDYKIIPVAKNFQPMTITLKAGQVVTGTVVDANTNKPIQNARVYTVSGTNADGEVQNEVYTDASGKYTLQNVESNFGYIGTMSYPVMDGSGRLSFINAPKYGNLPIKIYAVKSGNDAYLRQEKMSVGIASSNASTANFSLTPIAVNAQIWDIPIEINTASLRNGITYLSGAFVNLPGNNVFKTVGQNVKLPFSNIEVSFKAPTSPFGNLGKPIEVGKSTIVPKNAKIEVELSTLKVTANNYDFEVLGSDSYRGMERLAIEKNGGSGVLKGYVTSELSSFNFSYNYNGKFVLNTNKALAVNEKATYLPVFYANKAAQPESEYKLSALYNQSSFSIHNFAAKLSSGKFDGQAFYINANVALQIPLVGVSTMPAGQIKVARSGIDWSQYSGPINIPIEKWTIKGSGLAYNVNYGGFNVVGGTLVTDLPQMDLKDIMIMPKSVDLGETKTTGKELLTLGGVSLTLSNGARITLSYDNAAPFDQKPHYRLNISKADAMAKAVNAYSSVANNINTGITVQNGLYNSTNNQGASDFVASIKDLPGTNDAVNIKMLSTYSDGLHKTIMLEEKKVKYFNVVSQQLSGIDIGTNHFTLIGNTDLEIPGANANITGRFKFAKDGGTGSSSKNGITLSVDKLQTDVEMAGKVRFEGDSYVLRNNNLEVKGKVLIYKNSISDAIQGIRGTLTKTNVASIPNIKMDILPKQRIVMGSKSLEITIGGAVVNQNAWQNVTFTGRPINYVAKTPKGTVNLLKDGEDLIDFEVKGGIQNDEKSGRKIGISDVNTSFGNLSIAFDFDHKIFQGSLAFTDLNMVMGPVTVNTGTIDLQIDPNGFLLVGAVQNAAITAPLPDFIRSGFKSGFALGYYDAAIPAYLKTKLLGVTLYNELPSEISTGLKGYYVNIMRAINKDQLPKLPGPPLDQIPVIGSFVPTFDFSAGLDLCTYLNVNNGFNIGIGGKAFAQASYYYDLSMCTIGLSGGAFGAFDLKYDGELTGKIVFGIDGKLSYCVGNKSIGVNLLLSKESGGFKFTPSIR